MAQMQYKANASIIIVSAHVFAYTKRKRRTENIY